jgi:hypothetical protein
LRIEDVCGADAMAGLRYQTEKATVAVKAPGTALLHDLNPRLVVAIKQFVGHSASWGLVGAFEGF